MLSVEHGKTGEYRNLSFEMASELRSMFQKMELLIKDEVSMVSNVLLVFIHLRLHEILGPDDEIPFAGKHIVLGDLLPLAPVNGKHVFLPLSTAEAKKAIGCIGGVNLWQLLN